MGQRSWATSALGLAAIHERRGEETEAEPFLKEACALFGQLGWDVDPPDCDAALKALYQRIRAAHMAWGKGLWWFGARLGRRISGTVFLPRSDPFREGNLFSVLKSIGKEPISCFAD